MATLMRELFPDHDIKRGWQSAGAGDSDVVCPHLWVECKSHKQTNPRAALKQAIDEAEAAGSTKLPVAFCKDTGKRAFVVMRVDDWVSLVQMARAGGLA